MANDKEVLVGHILELQEIGLLPKIYAMKAHDDSPSLVWLGTAEYNNGKLLDFVVALYCEHWYGPHLPFKMTHYRDK